MVDVVSLGEMLIDMVSTQRNVTLYDAPCFEPKPGGAPANLAVGVQRLGKQAAFIGKLGRDEFGQGLRRLLEQEGVDTRNVLDDPERPTTLAFVSLSDQGDPHFAIFAAASANLAPADLNADLIRSAKIFHFSSVSLSAEPSRSATLEALRIAKDSGVRVSYDVNWRPALWPDVQKARQIIMEPLPQIDILKMNGGELRLITGIDDVEEALTKLDVPASVVFVTLSEKGCIYRFKGRIYRQSVTPVEVVDATGAGDAFMAVLLADLPDPLEETALARLARRACEAGKIATTRRGAIPALPYASDLAAFPV
jgi:fructokinase